MKFPSPSPDWPASWRSSHAFDALEISGAQPRTGYAYAYRARRSMTLDVFRRVVPPGSRVLDVAGAQGNFTLALAEMGYEVTWNDFRSELAGYVKAKHERGVVHYAPGNALELTFPHLFDGVLLGEVIEHVAHPDVFLKKISGFVRPGGWIVMTTPNGEYTRNPLPRFSDCPNPEQFEALQFRPDADGHIFLLHDDEIRSIASAAALEVGEIVYYANVFTSGHMKLNPLLRVVPTRVVDAIESATTRLPSRAVRKLHSGTIASLRRRVS